MKTEFQSRNPRTGEFLKAFALLNSNELERRIASSTLAQKAWRSVGVDRRIEVVTRIGQLLEERAEIYGQLMEDEMGKLLSEGIAEVKKCASLCFYSASQAAKTLGNSIEKAEGATISIRHDALGIILAVMPWNFPFWQLFRAAVPALLSGNVILLKHAMNTPQCALAIEGLFIEAAQGLPILQSLFIDHQQVEALIADHRVKGVTLTGSNRAGIAVGIAAAKAIKPCVLELGGSDPFLVFSDAKIEKAVETAVNSRCINNGQSCIAAKRFIIERSVFDRFCRLMTEQMLAREIGPMATQKQQQILDEQVKDAISQGAKLHCGGVISTLVGYFYPPTVLSQIKASMRVACEEVFGPVATLYSFDSDDEALRLANDSEFGLGATIFTENSERVRRFSNELESGLVFVNEMVRSDPRFPFGGVKESGYGRELGPRASLAFTNEKTVWTSNV